LSKSDYHKNKKCELFIETQCMHIDTIRPTCDNKPLGQVTKPPHYILTPTQTFEPWRSWFNADTKHFSAECRSDLKKQSAARAPVWLTGIPLTGNLPVWSQV